jgi:hypothetical protein
VYLEGHDDDDEEEQGIAMKEDFFTTIIHGNGAIFKTSRPIQKLLWKKLKS